MNTMMRTALAVGGLFALACSSGEDEAEAPPAPPPPAPIPAAEPPPATLQPGEVPFDFPKMSASSRAGQFALVPSREFLDRAIADGGEGTFIYYGATVQTPDSPESTIKSLSGTTFTMPNSMIISIRAGQKAKVGDILLGHWESGSGLQRAIVVGGTETAPVVRYLDMDYDNPSGWGQKDDTWQPDRFSVLTEPWQLGTTVACGEGNERKHGILTALSGNRILVSGFAGAITASSRDACVSLSPAATYAVGDSVWVPVVGSYVQGTVSKLESDKGRVFVSYEWGGQQKEGAFAVVDVTAEFAQAEVAEAPEPEDEATEDGEAAHPGANRPSRIPKGTKALGPRKNGKIGRGKGNSNSSGSGTDNSNNSNGSSGRPGGR